MNYERIPRGTPILVAQPAPSPLQQWIIQGKKQIAPKGYEIGCPVRICNLLSNDCKIYNDLVGDITDIHIEDKNDGTSEMFFDVRLPCRKDLMKGHNIAKDSLIAKVKMSMVAEQHAESNIKKLYGVSGAEAKADERFKIPPYVALYKLHSEKMEALSAKVVHEVEEPPPYAVREAVWGKPPDEYQPPQPATEYPQFGRPGMPVIDNDMPLPTPATMRSSAHCGSGGGQGFPMASFPGGFAGPPGSATMQPPGTLGPSMPPASMAPPSTLGPSMPYSPEGGYGYRPPQSASFNQAQQGGPGTPAGYMGRGDTFDTRYAGRSFDTLTPGTGTPSKSHTIPQGMAGGAGGTHVGDNPFATHINYGSGR